MASPSELPFPTVLPFDFLKKITYDFSADRRTSGGAFGTVYMGIVPDGQRMVVKKLESDALRDDTFTMKVQHIMAFEHKNIVKLVGYCHEAHKKVLQSNKKYIVANVFESLLCYEYFPNESLHMYLFGGGSPGRHTMDWYTRFKIIRGICDGLLFIHRIPLIHMVLKPENILLDHNLRPKIAEVGLSWLVGQQQTRTRICTQTIVSSHGYLAPEYICGGDISSHSDIYSLGLIIIETTTGEHKLKEPLEEFTEKVCKKWTDGYIASIYSKLNEHKEVKLCIEIGLECLQIDREKRPSIESIIARLKQKEKPDQHQFQSRYGHLFSGRTGAQGKNKPS